ncbi:MAG: 50S ribosomal protein L25 [Acidobacteria bacterium]|nr:50S ribosomal protein L25 [Acidobacteriota bacterium]
MERPTIDGEIRNERGKNAARRARAAGRVPGVLYGAGGGTLALSLDPRQLIAALRTHGHNTIFDLRLKDGDSSPAMMVESQFEPVKGKLLHVDLKRIAMDRRLRVSVPVIVAGDAKGVKTQGGLMEVVLREVELECLPSDIPDQITVAVDDLELNQAVRISDLQNIIGEKAQLVGDPQAVVCHVVTPKAEIAAATEIVAEAPVEPEVIKKGKGAEEGAEAAEAGEKPEKKK